LLAASVGSHLGLPDLFDTETGLSAIGRFGLMDGQGIFAYSGTYPPEPTPWSKIFMGWAEPVTVELSNTDVSIVTKLAAEIGDTVILKVPLNSSEYYLIENRSRDANDDGSSTVTYVVNGNTVTKTFTKDTTGYLSFDVDSLEGVVIDVDEFDWAIPGNGILIWHIDENVINEKIVANKINTDKKRRGVDVEEADGIQDIGEEFQTIFGDVVIGEGTDIDPWYSSNPSELFTNRFAKDTRPNTRTNTGANSLITIKDFSEISNRMNFKVEYGDSIIKPFLQSDIGQVSISNINVIKDGDQIKFALIDSENLLISDGQNLLDFVSNFSRFFKTASVNIGQNSYVIGFNFPRINYWFNDGINNSSGGFEITKVFSTPPTIRENSNTELELLFGTSAGIVYIYDLESIVNNTPILKDSLIINLVSPIRKISCSGSRIAVMDDHNIFLDDKIIYNDDDDTFQDIVTTVDKVGNFITIVLTLSKEIFVFSNDDLVSSFKLPKESYYRISLSDLKNDGENYIIVSNGNQLLAYNLSGSLADNFPLITSDDGVLFPALAADIEGDSKSEIIISNNNQNLYAFDGGNGRIINDFPISFAQSLAFPVLFEFNNKIGIAGIEHNTIFKAWYISSVTSKIYWSEIHHSFRLLKIIMP